jgi:hypothetical protein
VDLGVEPVGDDGARERPRGSQELLGRIRIATGIERGPHRLAAGSHAQVRVPTQPLANAVCQDVRDMRVTPLDNTLGEGQDS